MKSKKRIVTGIVVSLSLVLAIVGYQIADRRIVAEVKSSEANVKLYDNVNDLMKDTSLVVEATITSNSKQIDLINEYNDSYTLTEVVIDKIIKDDKKSPVTANNATVIEPVSIVDNGVIPGKTMLTMDEYTKLVPGAKYILFLNWSEQRNAYWIHALYQGKINIDGKDLRERDLYLHDDGFKKLKDSAFSNLK
jgi:hypothetical protein